MTAGEYGTPTHYLKGKDIKVPFDCLWHCYTRKFEVFLSHHDYREQSIIDIPEDFEKW